MNNAALTVKATPIATIFASHASRLRISAETKDLRRQPRRRQAKINTRYLDIAQRIAHQQHGYRQHAAAAVHVVASVRSSFVVSRNIAVPFKGWHALRLCEGRGRASSSGHP